MARLLLLVVLLFAASIGPAAAGPSDSRLDPLFARLKTTTMEDEAHAIEAAIWSIWNESGDPETDRLMATGAIAMSEGDTDSALSAFDEVVKRQPDFAEGWNKRATVHYLRGELSASVSDIEQTLALEPRHFGALYGLGEIYLALDEKKAALKAFGAALAIDPHLAGAKEEVERLTKEIEGEPT